MTHLRYRADIDGLRALAVLAVVIFHAFPKWLPGGFVGVDIFFVISGYLISGILYKGVKDGGFSFREFYARRAKRLFPSLITVLTVCLVYGYFVLLQDEYRRLGKFVGAGALFIQNIVFFKESGYFDAASVLNPLLNLWSLAVEEQLYIFFPPVLILFWKKRLQLGPILLVMLAASFLFNIYMAHHDREAGFFLTPFRAWEFLSGSLLAWWHFGRNHERDVYYSNALSMLGSLLLAFGLAQIELSGHFAGLRTALPVLGSVMIIAGGTHAWINRTILSHPVVVWIGLISYPLYLFHWPALSFVHIIKGRNPSDSYIWGALVVAFALTVVTYYFVEKPVRFSKSKHVVWILIIAFVTIGIFGWIIFKKGITSKSSPSTEKIAEALRDKAVFKGWVNQDREEDGPWVCWTGGAMAKTLYFGDSNIWQYAPRILKIMQCISHNPHGAIIMGSGGTPPIPDCETLDHNRVERLFKKLEKTLSEDIAIKRIVIAAAWDIYFAKESKYFIHGKCLADPLGQKEAIECLGKMIYTLKKNGKDVVVVLSVPVGTLLDPNNLFHRNFTGLSLRRPDPITKEAFLSSECHRELRGLLRDVSKINGAQVIDPLDYLCKDNICIFENSDGPIRYDAYHLRSGYVRDHLKYLDSTAYH